MPSLFSDSETQPGVGRLSDLTDGQTGDVFALLAKRERATTRDGKPYYRCSFRDAGRSATAMIWNDTGWFADCETAWQTGHFYKIRCRYSESNYGPQIEIDRIREVTEEDADDGFDPGDFVAASRFDADDMFNELLEIVETHVDNGPLRQLVIEILTEHADDVKTFPAASRNHHAYRGGYLEHTLSVVKTALYLAEKYIDYYPDMQPPLSKSLVVAGATLHDIGKLIELEVKPGNAEYSPPGRLVGHILLGRDMVREQAREIDDFDAETLLRLEHIIIAHQNLPEWGSPIAPHTPEALLVHFADDTDAKFHMMALALEATPSEDEQFTPRDNPLRRSIFRGL